MLTLFSYYIIIWGFFLNLSKFFIVCMSVTFAPTKLNHSDLATVGML